MQIYLHDWSQVHQCIHTSKKRWSWKQEHINSSVVTSW